MFSGSVGLENMLCDINGDGMDNLNKDNVSGVSATPTTKTGITADADVVITNKVGQTASGNMGAAAIANGATYTNPAYEYRVVSSKDVADFIGVAKAEVSETLLFVHLDKSLICPPLLSLSQVIFLACVGVDAVEYARELSGLCQKVSPAHV